MSKVIIRFNVLVTSMGNQVGSPVHSVEVVILMRDEHGGRNIRLISKVIPFFFFFFWLLISDTLLRIKT